MIDYESDFVFMIPLEHKIPQVFYEDIIHVPARIRGALIANNEKSKKKIGFRIIDPTGEVIMTKKIKEFIFDFTTTRRGKFTFEFTNLKVKSLFNIK